MLRATSLALVIAYAGCRERPVPVAAIAPVEPAAAEAIPAALPADDAQLNLDVNIPAYRLDVREGSRVVRSYRVAVGMPDFRTHRGEFVITRIQWNPWWVPPKSEWAKKEKITPPGPTNPMGKVKIQFHELLFIHATPDEGSLGKPSSHGCVRLSTRDAIELATRLQGASFESAAVDSVLRRATADWNPLDVSLIQPIDVRVRYDLVELRNDTLWVFADPYGLGTSPADDAIRELARAGHDTTALDLARVRRLRRYPARVPIAVPLGDR